MQSLAEADEKRCRFVDINRIWDRVSKVLICLVDASLNWYFLKVVKQRLLDQYGLMKYEPLVGFNARLMVISVLLDVSLPLCQKLNMECTIDNMFGNTGPPYRSYVSS